MLQNIRDKSQGWITWVIVGLIALTFVLIGTGSYFGNDKAPILAKVNGEKITQRDVDQFYDRVLLQQGSNADTLDSTKIKKIALDALVQQAALKTSIEREGFRISKQQLMQQVTQDPMFQENGEFSSQKYQNLLAQNYFSDAQYMDMLESRYFMVQLQHGLMQSNFSLEEDVKTLFKYLDQSRSFDYRVVSRNDFMNAVKVTDKEAEDYYKANKPLFMTDEKLKVAYIELNPEEIKSTITYTDSDLQNFYKANLAAFSEPERIKVSHILVAFDPKSEKAKKDAQAKVTMIQEKLKKGEDFGALAKQYSDDIVSGKNEGDLPWMVKGQNAFVPEFEAGAFALKDINSVSPVVQTSYGFHLIKLLNHVKQEIYPFEAVKPKVAYAYQTQKSEEALFEKADVLANEVYDHSDSLKSASEKLQLPIKETDYFTRAGGSLPLTQDPAFLKAAFSTEVIEEGRNSDLIELKENQYAVVRVLDYKRPEERPFNDVKLDILALLTRQKASKMAEVEAKKLQAQLADKSIDAVVSGADWLKASDVKRISNRLPKSLVEKAFTLVKARPTDIVEITDGDYAVVVLRNVIDGTMGSVDKERLTFMEKSLAQNLGQIDFQLFAKQADKSAKIVYEKKLSEKSGSQPEE